MSESLGTHKRGDTFAYVAEIVDGESPVTGAEEKLRSQVRRKFDMKFIAELVVSETETPGMYQFLCNNSTQGWDAAEYVVDIEYADNGVIVSSDTFDLVVVEDVTHDEV